MSILTVSTQSEQGAVISALLLWRNLGMVVGIASSSLVVQNALKHYLNLFVVGDQKGEVIKRVTASIEAVLTLNQPYQEQVIQSFEASLRLMFGCCTLLACVGLLSVWPIKLPRLAAKKE